jgi:hypothetical protein
MAQVITFPSAVTNYRAAGVTSLMVKANDDAAYYHLGHTRDAQLKISQQSEVDTFLRPFSPSVLIEATIPSIQAAGAPIIALGTLVTDLPIAVRIGLSDDTYIQSTDLLSLRWKLQCDSDPAKFRFIEYMIRGIVKHSELDAIVTESGVSIGTPGGGDALTGSFTQTPNMAHQVPAGVTKIEVKEKSDDAYVDMGDFRDAKWTWECVGDEMKGGRGHYGTTAFKFTFDAILRQASNATADLFDTFAGCELNLKLTHTDGAIMTLASPMVGLVMSLDSSGNMDKTRGVPIHAEGIIRPTVGTALAAGWAAIWSS